MRVFTQTEVVVMMLLLLTQGEATQKQQATGRGRWNFEEMRLARLPSGCGTLAGLVAFFLRARALAGELAAWLVHARLAVLLRSYFRFTFLRNNNFPRQRVEANTC